MEVSAILLARAVVFVPIEELASGGRVSVFALRDALVRQFGFTKSPETFEEFDESKGIQFLYGRWKEKEITRLFVWSSAVVVDTKSSTDDAIAAIDDMLSLAASLGWNRRSAAAERKAFTSQIVFTSQARMDELNPVLRVLQARIGKSVSEHLRYEVSYETTGVVLNFDQAAIKLPVVNFTLERRADALFSENRYFSSAPLPTEEHIALLKECESALLSQTKLRSRDRSG